MAGNVKRRLTAGGMLGARLYALACFVPAFLISDLLGLDGPGEYWYTVALGVAMAVPVYLLLRSGDRALAKLRKDGAETVEAPGPEDATAP